MALSADPATCPIVAGQETVIEIAKGRSGLGLSIVGGKDTQLVRPPPTLKHPVTLSDQPALTHTHTYTYRDRLRAVCEAGVICSIMQGPEGSVD